MGKRNHSIDMLKGVAAMFVVFIHAKFVGISGEVVATLGNFAVPVFFMVSGYFGYRITKGKATKSALHILKLLAFAYVLNFLRIFVTEECSVKLMCEYLMSNILTVKHVIQWVVLNVTLISGVAWFLWALFYCYLFCIICNKMFNSRSAYIVLGIGFGGGICTSMLYQVVGTNNVWFCGLPYFLLGKLIHEKQDKILDCLKTYQLILIVILGILLDISGMITHNGAGYLGAFLISSGLFCLVLKHPKNKENFLSEMGSIYAFFIYIMHPIVMHIFDALFSDFENGILTWFRPLIILIFTIIISIVFEKIKRKYSLRRKDINGWKNKN